MRKAPDIGLVRVLWLVGALGLAGCAAVGGEATIDTAASLAPANSSVAPAQPSTDSVDPSPQASDAAKSPDPQPTATWSVKDSEGDEARVTLSFGPFVAADDPSVPSQVNPDCILDQPPGRYLAVPFALSASLKSTVPVTFMPNIKYSIDVVDKNSMDGVSGVGEGFWIDDKGGCAENGQDLVYGWNLTPSASPDELDGWFLVPGITVGDPTGAKSYAHQLLFEESFMLGSEPATATADSGSTLVSCSSSVKVPSLLPLDLVGARKAGCK